MSEGEDRERRRQRYEKANEWFHRLVDRDEDDARRILEVACADDRDLEEHILRLLRREWAGGSSANVLRVHTRRSPAPDLQPGERIGPYRLEKLLGEGGMGLVYLAEQERPIRRKVAIKALKHGWWGEQILARFENEKQTLALMEHPCVAKVYDAGIHGEGRPYFVMEYVDGIPFIEYCDQHRLGVRERLDLFLQVCDAVQHAHQKGVIHRDLKPSNVLIARQDGAPMPKVIDFGIAKAVSQKLMDRTHVTEEGQFVGTPEYMSPEQADVGAEDIDTRSDIYSLGVLLFEVMTGCLPFDAAELRKAGFAAMQRMIKEQEPPRPSTRLVALGERASEIARQRNTDLRDLVGKLAGDLDWVILKALEKDRDRRYASATGFATDIRRHLNDEPVSAHAPTAGYRLRKFVRRNRATVSSAAIVIVALLAGLVVAGIGMVRAGRERDRARLEAEKATEIGRFLSGILTSVQPERTRGRELTVREILDEAAGRIDGAFPGKEEVEALIRLSIGESYRALGRYGEAENHLQSAAALARSSMAENDPSRLRIEVGLGYLTMLQGRYGESERLLRPALEGLIAVRGERHERTLQAMNLLALVLMEQGKNADAEELFRRVVSLRSEMLGEDDAETLRAVANLARVQLGQSEFDEAIISSEHAERRSRAVLGSDHPVTIYAISVHASCLESSGDMGATGRLRREAYEQSRKVFGVSHPYTILALRLFADHLGTMGREEEARLLLREALHSQREHLGPTHPQTLETMIALANHLPYTRKESGDLYREVHEIRSAMLGPDDPTTIDALNDLGIWHWRSNQLDEAERAFRRVIEARTSTLGGSAGLTLDAQSNLALVLKGRGRLPEAERMQREVLAERLSHFPDDSPIVAGARLNLALSLMDSGSYEEARTLLAAVFESYQKSFGKDHRKTLDAAATLSRAMIEVGREREAERILNRALERSLVVFGEDHLVTKRIQANLGLSYAGTERSARGERLLLDVWKWYASSFGGDAPRSMMIGRTISDFYRRAGRSAEALEWEDGRPSSGFVANAPREKRTW